MQAAKKISSYALDKQQQYMERWKDLEKKNICRYVVLHNNFINHSAQCKGADFNTDEKDWKQLITDGKEANQVSTERTG